MLPVFPTRRLAVLAVLIRVQLDSLLQTFLQLWAAQQEGEGANYWKKGNVRKKKSRIKDLFCIISDSNSLTVDFQHRSSIGAAAELPNIEQSHH